VLFKTIINEHGQHIENTSMTSTFVHQSHMNDLSAITTLFAGHRCNPFHGMIRANTLKTTSLVGSYPSSDLVLIGELVLHGEFYEIPEYLFFKRSSEHVSASISHIQRTHRLVRSSKKGQLHLTRWKWFFEYLAAIRRVRMSCEKARCYMQMAKWFIWNWIFLRLN